MVRIVKDYWTNVKTHEDLIKRCFYHLSYKFPNPDGFDDSYDHMLAKMACFKGGTDIFRKFKPAMHSKDIVDKRFEQWIYMWMHHILEEYYLKRRLHANRFKTTNFAKDFNKETVQEWRACHHMYRWDDEKPHTPKNPNNTQRKPKYIPTIDDLGNYLTDQNEDPLSGIIAEETKDIVRRRLASDKERKVYDLMLDGLQPKDIAPVMGTTSSCVSAHIKKIREVYADLQVV